MGLMRHAEYLARQAVANARARARGQRYSATLPPMVASSEEPERPGQLEQYFDAHTTGRGIWKWRHYFAIYERHLGRFVGQAPDLVEVGIYSGGSLGMWHAYFGANTTVYGVDIEDACRTYEAPGTRVFIGDQADPAFWAAFLTEIPAFDVFIDDGGHKPHQQIATLEAILPHLRPGGVYICEDVHGPGNAFLGYVDGFSRSLHGMAEAGSLGFATNTVQGSIDSIHIYPFVTVIEKRRRPLDSLEGPRRGTQWQPFYEEREPRSRDSDPTVGADGSSR